MKNFGFSEDVQFVPIFHLGRSGSTHLERSLATSFAALSLGEIFNQAVSLPFLKGSHNWRNFFGDDVASFLAFCFLRGLEGRYWANQASAGTFAQPRIIFFEYKPSLLHHAFHASHGTLLLRLSELGIRRAIVLERRSVVRRILSSLSAQRTRVYHSDQLASSETLALMPFHFDVERVIDDGINPGFAYPLSDVQDLNDIYFAKLRLELRATGFDVLSLQYERDLCGPIETVVKTVADFMGVAPSQPPESRLAKLLPDDLSQFVSNSEQVIEYCERLGVRI
jgi:hypothetical protein